MTRHPILLALMLGAALPACAETLVCPDPAAAVQVATCPSEEQLKYTYNGFCSDDRRLYARDYDTCANYENYRKEKNVALWESADGAFQAYVSCDLPAGALQRLKAATIAVTRQGKLTRVACRTPTWPRTISPSASRSAPKNRGCSSSAKPARAKPTSPWP